MSLEATFITSLSFLGSVTTTGIVSMCCYVGQGGKISRALGHVALVFAKVNRSKLGFLKEKYFFVL
jgi:hypothetical protein